MEDQDKQVMQLLQSQSDIAPTTPSSSEAGADTPPMGAPMSTPEPKEGEKAAAKINVQMAMELLQQSLPAFGSDTEEGKAIMKIVKEISKSFGTREAQTKELIPAEIIQMMQTLPQAAGATPEQKVAQSQPAIQPPMPPQPAAQPQLGA